MKPVLLCLDMESVLTPEIWVEVANATGIKELLLTTKDIADFDDLMKYRLKHLELNGITLTKIKEVVKNLEPLPGAIEFLDWARENFQVIILSDSFIELAKPLLNKMKNPTIFTHNLLIVNDKIIDYKLRMEDQKTEAIKRFNELNYNTIAVGDSLNDTGMLAVAKHGFFFQAGEKAKTLFPHIPVVNDYEELKNSILIACNYNY